MTFVRYSRSGGVGSHQPAGEWLADALEGVLRQATSTEQGYPNAETWHWELHHADYAALARDLRNGSRWTAMAIDLASNGRLFGLEVRRRFSRGDRASQLVVTEPLTTVYPGPPLDREEIADDAEM